MAHVRALIVGLALVAGCKPEPHRGDAAPPWWKPAPGDIQNWDIQLAASPVDFSVPRKMYTLELFKAVPSPMVIEYPSGPLTIPAGAHATAIAQLRVQSPPPIIVCHVGTGAIRLDDPDAMKFPGYQASPPNRPDAIAPGSAIGWSTKETRPEERFIDIHADSRATVFPLIEKRIQLAKDIGCDAIAVEHNDLLAYQGMGQIGHGFADLSRTEYVSWSTAVVDRAHDVAMSVGMRNGITIGTDDLARHYDWAMVDRCAEFSLCDPLRPFFNRNKAVFAIEYDKNEDGEMNNPELLCVELRTAGINDGIIKSAELSSALWMGCE